MPPLRALVTFTRPRMLPTDRPRRVSAIHSVATEASLPLETGRRVTELPLRMLTEFDLVTSLILVGSLLDRLPAVFSCHPQLLEEAVTVTLTAHA